MFKHGCSLRPTSRDDDHVEYRHLLITRRNHFKVSILAPAATDRQPEQTNAIVVFNANTEVNASQDRSEQSRP